MATLAFVLLSKPVMPESAELVAAFARFAPGATLRPGEREERERAAVLDLDIDGQSRAFLTLMHLAIPTGEVEEAARFSLSTLAAGWQLPEHHAHLVVSLVEEDDDPLTRMQLFTSLVAAVTSITPSVGVYWGAAGATHSPGLFVQTAEDPDIVPRITLWTGLSVAHDSPGRVSLLSLGMHQLGLPELLLSAPESKMQPTLMMFFDLLAYVVDLGEPIPEGHTIGTSKDERLPVRYVPSPVKPDEQVWRIDLP